MATHSNLLAWRIPWTEEPGGLHHWIAKSWTGLKSLSMHTRAGFYFSVTFILCSF